MRPVRLSPNHTSARVLEILHRTRALLARDGWYRGEFYASPWGVPRDRSPLDGWTLVDALNASADADDLQRWTARELLQRVCPDRNLVRWNAFGARDAADVLRVVDDAIHAAGGARPRRFNRPALRRGGWFVSLHS